MRLHLGDLEEVRARFATVQEKQIILLADLNRLQVAEPLVLLGVLDCLYASAERAGVCSFAGSGSINSTLLTCTASIRGYIKNLMVCLVEYPISHTLNTITELARCVGCLSTRAGWFNHIEPTRTYTNTSTEEPHHHRNSKVCRVLKH